jgi:beta-lactamase regulating signal transducer with metallopeptidase domain
MNLAWESFFSWLFDFGCLTSVLLAAALLLRWVLRDPAGRVRLAWSTWLAVLAGGVMIALPAWPRIDLSVWLAPPLGRTQVVMVEESAAVDYAYLSAELESLEPIAWPSPSPAPAGVVPALSPALLSARAWLLVAALSCCWLAIGLFRAWRLIARSQPAPDWTRRELRQIVGPRRAGLPELLTNKQLATAIALGTLRPKVILPLASASESNVPAVRAALAHEWAHIRRGDLWLLALERSLLPLLALHPLFWCLRRLTRLDQELAADADAAGDKPAEYAEALLAWAKGEPHRRAGVAALAMWERPSNLSRRIAMILDSPRWRASAAHRGPRTTR